MPETDHLAAHIKTTNNTTDGKEIYSITELNEAHRALLSTLHKCEKINLEKLGKSQRTLLERRISALKIALSLIEKEQASY